VDLKRYSLDDRYLLDEGRVVLSGIQALARLPMMQRRLDLAAGLNTAGFIAGYRGSPLGVYDLELQRQARLLGEHHIHVSPAVNEEIAATAVWGSQQTNFYPGARYDGVFGLWYGKGAGFDRCGDAIRHANAQGVSARGGVLAVVGDDHMAKSSSQAHACELMFEDLGAPVLFPANVQEVLDYGLIGWAMSRHSGCWVGLKILPETSDASMTVELGGGRQTVLVPPGPARDIYFRQPDPVIDQETRLHTVKLAAAGALARLNGLDKVMLAAPRPRFGIVTAGKAYLDVRQALRLLGLSDKQAADLGVTVYKVGMPWPLQAEPLRAFAAGLEQLLVVEEKRPILEQQVKEHLYDLPDGARPRVYGRNDEAAPLIPTFGGVTPEFLAGIIGRKLEQLTGENLFSNRLAALEAHAPKLDPVGLERIAHLCSGCPHSTSTRVPEGSRAIAGIGCHSMAMYMPERRTDTLPVMGGEGVAWVGQAPFTDQPHVFANLGDGTYYHSGTLAIRQAIAAGVNVTYKILFNDAVAMTGGQAIDGPITVPQVTRQLAAEGVETIVVLTDNPEKYPTDAGFAPGVTIEHRDALEKVQLQLREIPGVTALVYDQVCASELRRRRKRGLIPEAPQRVIINEAVCEGCGDCSVQSNCVSIEPRETEFGRKRQINQSTCNKDLSCLKGFCPSFVTFEGAELRKPERDGAPPAAPQTPLPAVAELTAPRRILLTGVGGTGVVTVGAILSTAALLDGVASTALDQIGFAQKGGAVACHLTLAQSGGDIFALRIAPGEADVLIAADAVMTAAPAILAHLDPERTAAVVNLDVTPVLAFTRNPLMDFEHSALQRRIAAFTRPDATDFIPATRMALDVAGDSIAANLLMTGYAYQKGLIPLSLAAIDRAIELNGIAVEMNKAAFAWGRAVAHDPAVLEAPGGGAPAAQSVADLVQRRASVLTAYQDARHAETYRALVRGAEQAEQLRTPGLTGFAEAVARYAFKVMAYKDEYEVARLYTDGAFEAALRGAFEGGRAALYLSPPLLARIDPLTGRPRKMRFGPWIFPALRLLRRLKILRGHWFDPFGHTEERRSERRLIAEYLRTMGEVSKALTPANHGLAVALASVPDEIRGFGPVKMANLARAATRRTELWAEFEAASDSTGLPPSAARSEMLQSI
jgi:indolepyruvate ferredoxin oxidoreductase